MSLLSLVFFLSSTSSGYYSIFQIYSFFPEWNEKSRMMVFPCVSLSKRKGKCQWNVSKQKGEGRRMTDGVSQHHTHTQHTHTYTWLGEGLCHCVSVLAATHRQLWPVPRRCKHHRLLWGFLSLSAQNFAVTLFPRQSHTAPSCTRRSISRSF